MADSFRLDPDALRKVVAAARSTGSDLTRADAALEAVLTQHDGCWGTDDIGKGFGEKYTKDAADGRAAITSWAGGFESYAKNAEDIGEQFMELSEENASSVFTAYVDHDYAEQMKTSEDQQKEQAANGQKQA